MAENSKIEWTDATWNPILGCDKISPGCKNCYAIRTAHRLQSNPNPKVAKAFEGLTVIQGGQPNWTGRVNFIEERLLQPIRWKEPRRIFVNSQSDLFHDNVSFEQIQKIWDVMTACIEHGHIFQVLTKRPARMLEFTRWMAGQDHISIAEWPRNVWLGVSCENQQTADERIPLLLQTPAAVRWVSAEPLLGPIDFNAIPYRLTEPPRLGNIHWCVAGGESGPNARPMHPDWARSLRDQCQAAGVPYFFKQWGEWLPALDQKLASSWSAANDQDFRPKKFRMMGRLAKEGEPIFGGRKFQSCTVGSDMVLVSRVGKKAAGRLLDGREWNEYPESAQ